MNNPMIALLAGAAIAAASRTCPACADDGHIVAGTIGGFAAGAGLAS